MKKRNNRLNKKIILVAATVLVVGGAGTVTALALQPEREAPKTNISTSQTMQTEQQAVTPAESTPATVAEQQESQSEQQGEPVTVAAVEQVPVGEAGSVDCKLTYSDGTTFQWHWKTVSPNTHQNGFCDETIVGQPKAEGTTYGWGETGNEWQLRNFHTD